MLENIKNKKNTIYIITIFLIYIFLQVTIFKVSCINILKFVIYNIFSIYLPGILICHFSKIRLSKIGFFTIPYLIGYALLIAEYFFSEIFDRRISFLAVIIFVGCISSIFLFYLIYKKRNIIETYESGFDNLSFIMLFIWLIINVVLYSAAQMGPDSLNCFETTRDLQYWANNNVSLKLSWPADMLFMSGQRLNYHYFSSIAIAFLSEAYKVDIFTLSFTFYSFSKSIIMIGAVTFFIESFMPKKKTAVFSYIIMLFTCGIEKISKILFVNFMIALPFGFDIGFAYAVLFIALMLRQWEKENFDGGLFLLTFISWAMCVGSKAPLAFIIIFFAALICLYWLINKKLKLAFTYGLSILGSFLIICKFCVGLFSVIKGDSLWSIKPYSIERIMRIDGPESFDILGNLLADIGSGNIILAIIVKFLSVNPIVSVLFIYTSILSVIYIKKKKLNTKTMYLMASLIITGFIGYLLGYIIDAGALSEAYFLLAGIITVYAYILYVWNYYNEFKEEHFSAFSKKTETIFTTIFIMSMVIGFGRFWFCSLLDEGALSFAYKGINNIININNENYSLDNDEMAIRQTDCQALSWVRDNTEKDSLVLVDRAIMTDNAAYYMYGIFTERQNYIEGINMLNRYDKVINDEIERRILVANDLFSNKKDAYIKIKNDGIDYVVQTKDITPGFIPNSDYLELMMSSDTVNVYRVIY